MIDMIRKRILKDTGILVIPANTTAKKPQLPYATINVISAWINERGHADEFRYLDEEGVHMQRSEMYQYVLSFNAYGVSDMAAMQLAKQIRTWFVMKGDYFLEEELNTVVVSRGNVENRTTFLVESYENKHGFDVRLRTTRDERFTNYQQDGEGATYDWIEKAIIEYEGVK